MRRMKSWVRVSLAVSVISLSFWAFSTTEAQVTLLPGDLGDGPAVGEQLAPAIAAGGPGYLVAWQDWRTTPFTGPPASAQGRGVDIYARRLDAAGAPLDASPINIALGFGDQVAPQVAWNGENWLVAWETPCECWSYSSQIQAVRVSPAGLVLDATPIIVHTNASEYFRLTANGNEWLVVLDSLRGVRVLASGELVNPGGTQFAIRSTTGRHAIVSAQGEYLLAWDGYGPAKGQRFNADLTPIGGEFPLTSVNIASSGSDYFLAWTVDDTYWDDFVYGRQVALDGTQGPTITLAGTGGGMPLWNPAQHSLGWDGTHWWVAWLETARGAVFTRVQPDGTVLDFGGVAADPTVPTSDAYAPAIVGRPTGGAEVVWQDQRGDGFYDIFSAAVDAAGTPAASVAVSNSSSAQLYPDLATGVNETMAVFVSEHSGQRSVVVQRFDNDGNPIDTEPIEVAAGPGLASPHVGFDGTRYMVVWAVGQQVYGRRLQTDGTPIDPAPLAIMAGLSPDVAGLNGAFLVVASQRTINEHTYQPHSMRVDGSSGFLLDGSPVVIGGSFTRYPRVIAFAGRWLATWQRNFTHDNPNSNVHAAFIEPDGSTSGDLIVGSGGVPDVAANETTALVAWRTGSPGFGNDIVARFVGADGTLGAATLTVSAGPEDDTTPTVAWDGTDFVVAWADGRNRIIYFDERTQVYAARVATDGTVVDTGGFAFGDRAHLETSPTITSFGGRTLIAASSFRDEAPHRIFRVAYQVYGDPETGNRWPVALESAVPVQGDVPLAVSLDASASFDPDGFVTGHDWSFGDGAVDSGPNASHTYVTSGNYLAQVGVTDDQGATTHNVVRVVAEPVNQIPIAVPTADVTSGDPPLSVVFSARDSWDPDTGIQNWEWDFGDGWDYWGSTAYHTFQTPGTWTVTLMVHDFRGAIGTGTMTIQVGEPNESPVASAYASLLGGPAPLDLSFDGSGSFDVDGSVASFNWNFGDGNSGTGPAPEHVYDVPGSYTATLTVVDDDGASSDAQVVIEVGSGPVPGFATADSATPVGTITSGTFLDTRDQNDVCEALTEYRTPDLPEERLSLLEHVWALTVDPGPYQVFHLDAYHTPNTEGDAFLFEYSRDQLVWTPMVTVGATFDDDQHLEYAFTENVTGTLYVRVTDTDRTPGNGRADTVFVDEMFVMSMPSAGWVGSVPDRESLGGALQVSRNLDGTLELAWGQSCMTSDTDFAVYEGPIGAFADHVPVACSTGGLTATSLTPDGGSSYYLVVAHDGAYEGTHGDGGLLGGPRATGPVQCLPTATGTGCP